MDLDIWKKAKKEKKLTIAQIAEKANLPKGTVQNIFCGYCTIKIQFVKGVFKKR